MTAAFVTTRIARSAAEIGAAAWNACANPEGSADCDPFTRFEFFAALELSRSASPETGWTPCHLVIESGDSVQSILPLYLKDHSLGEYVFDHAWAEALERAGGRYYPKLQSSVPFTPVTGRRLLVAGGTERPQAQRALLMAGADATNRLGASSLHVTFMTEAEWSAAAACGYLLRTDVQFHWENEAYSSFEDFLGRLSSSRRKNLRKERVAVHQEGISFEWLSGSDLRESHWDEFFGFYMNTGNRKWGHPYLTREFFSRIGADMGESVLLILARRAGRPIAGALNFIGERVLFGRNWGAGEFVPFLHFETCYYQAIEFAIVNGLRKVEAGAQGPHKLLRGYRPVTTHSAHYISHDGLRGAVARYLSQERELVASEIDEAAMAVPFRKEE